MMAEPTAKAAGPAKLFGPQQPLGPMDPCHGGFTSFPRWVWVYLLVGDQTHLAVFPNHSTSRHSVSYLLR